MQTSNQPVLFVFRRALFIVTGVLIFLIAGINPATAASIKGVDTCSSPGKDRTTR